MYGPNGYYPSYYYVSYPQQTPIQNPAQQAQTSGHTDSPRWVVQDASIEQSKAIIDALGQLETTTKPRVYHEALAQIFNQGLYRCLSTQGMLCLLGALDSPLAPTTRHSTELYIRLMSFLARHGGGYTFSDYSFGIKLAAERVPFCDQDRTALAKALSGVVQNTVDRLVIDRPSSRQVLEWLGRMAHVKNCDDPAVLSRAVGRVINYLDKDMGLLSQEEILQVIYVGTLFHVQGSDWLHVLNQSVDRLLAVGSSLSSNSAVKLLYILTVYECTDLSRIRRVLENISYPKLNTEGRQLLGQVHFACEEMPLECSGKPLVELVGAALPREGYLPPRELDELVELCNALRLGATKGGVIGPYSVDVSYRDTRIAVIVQTTMERVQPGRSVLRARYLRNQFYRVVSIDLEELRALPSYQWPAWLKEKLDLNPAIWGASSLHWPSSSFDAAEQTTLDDEEVTFAHFPENDVESVDDLCKFWIDHPSKELVKPTVDSLRTLIVQPFAEVGEEIALLVELILYSRMQEWQSDLAPIKEMLVAYMIRELDMIKKAGKWDALPERLIRACFREWLVDGNLNQLQQYATALQLLLGNTMEAEALQVMRTSDRTLPDASLIWLLSGGSTLQELGKTFERRLMLAVQQGDTEMVNVILSAAPERFPLHSSTLLETVVALARNPQQGLLAVPALVRYLVPGGNRAARVDRTELSRLYNAVLRMLAVVSESERSALFQTGLILLTAEIEKLPKKFDPMAMTDKVLALAKYGDITALYHSSKSIQRVIKVALAAHERSDSPADWKRWKRLSSTFKVPIGQEAILSIAAGWSAKGRPDKAFHVLHDTVKRGTTSELCIRLICVAEQCLGQGHIEPFKMTLDYFQKCPKGLCERLKQLWVKCLDSEAMRASHSSEIVRLLLQHHQVVSKLMRNTVAHPQEAGKGATASTCTGLSCALIRLCTAMMDSPESVFHILTTYSLRNAGIWNLWWETVDRSGNCDLELIRRAWAFLYVPEACLEGNGRAKAYEAACRTMCRHSPGFVSSVCQDYELASRVLTSIEGAPSAWFGLKMLKVLCSEGAQLSKSDRNLVTIATVRHCSTCQESLNGLLVDLEISQMNQLIQTVCESVEALTNEDERVIANLLALRMGQIILIRKLAPAMHLDDLNHCTGEIVRYMRQSTLQSVHIEGMDHYVSAVVTVVTQPTLAANSKQQLGCALLRTSAIITRQQTSAIDRVYWLSIFLDALEAIAPHIAFDQYELLADFPELIIGMAARDSAVLVDGMYTVIFNRFRRFYLSYVLRAIKDPSCSQVVATLSIGCLSALERRWKYTLSDSPLCGMYRTLAVMALRGLIGQAEILKEFWISDCTRNLIHRCLSLTVHRSCEMAMVAFEHETTAGVLEDATRLVDQFREYLSADSLHEMKQRLRAYVPRELSASSTESIPMGPWFGNSGDQISAPSNSMVDLQRRLGVDSEETVTDDLQTMEVRLCEKIKVVIEELGTGRFSQEWMAELVKSLRMLFQAGQRSETLRNPMINLYKAVLDQVPMCAAGVSSIPWLHEFMEILPSPELSQELYTEFDRLEKPLMALVAFSHTRAMTFEPETIHKVHGWISAIWQQEVDRLSAVNVDVDQLPVVVDRLTDSLEWAHQVWSRCFVGVDGAGVIRAEGIHLWMPAWMRVFSKNICAAGKEPPDTDWTVLKGFMVDVRYDAQAMLGSLFDRSVQQTFVNRWIIVLDASVRYVAHHPALVDIMMNEVLYWKTYRQECLISS